MNETMAVPIGDGKTLIISVCGMPYTNPAVIVCMSTGEEDFRLELLPNSAHRFAQALINVAGNEERKSVSQTRIS